MSAKPQVRTATARVGRRGSEPRGVDARPGRADREPVVGPVQALAAGAGHVGWDAGSMGDRNAAQVTTSMGLGAGGVTAG